MIQGAGLSSPSRLKGRKSWPIEVLGLIYFFTVALAGCLLVLQPATVVALQDKRQALEVTLSDLKLRAEDLKKTVSAMESLDYVEYQARENLGMVEPTLVKTLAVEGKEPPQEIFVSNPSRENKGILSLLFRIAEIFETKEATAKEKP